MLELDNLKIELLDKESVLLEIYNSLDIEKKNSRIKEINRLMEDNKFWDDVKKANEISKELKDINDSIDTYKKLKTTYNDLLELIELANIENDNKLAKEIINQYQSFLSNLEDTRISLLLSGEYDKLDAILKLNAGSGGTESCDFCQMLFRMYSKYALNHSFELSVLDFLDGDGAGIKSVSFVLKGQYAYGYLKSEMGVHRLVRLSPFNAQNKRQTSLIHQPFTSIVLLPAMR